MAVSSLPARANGENTAGNVGLVTKELFQAGLQILRMFKGCELSQTHIKKAPVGQGLVSPGQTPFPLRPQLCSLALAVGPPEVVVGVPGLRKQVDRCTSLLGSEEGLRRPRGVEVNLLGD